MHKLGKGCAMSILVSSVYFLAMDLLLYDEYYLNCYFDTEIV